MSEINRILVANRGEIACRVLKTVRAMGLSGVAVYSDADAHAPHTGLADEAVHIGPAPVGDSYLSIERILEAAKASGADAVHPGYGFLSENADFAKACAKAGLVFIGPPAEAIELMGNKAESKRRMLKAEVPCIPGYEDKDQSDKRLVAAGKEIGAPLMVKAAAGGGGRGMRLVEDLKGLPDAIERARSEAENAFGSGELILEKAVLKPRHVEIQVFADTHGNIVHLGERECSVQRRHQKIIEEAPCPVMTPELRAEMGAAAVRVAAEIGYVGAGTVEFLLDDARNFYFLEMNTRLQVEHPVTELVTGLDLVEMQIRAAAGETLPIAQDDVAIAGHAIEARLYAEDPDQDFLPATGPIDLWRPAAGDGVRIDDGIRTGQEVSPFYDPMVAKIIAYGPDRETARRRLAKALGETVLFGPKTNKAFLLECLDLEAFRTGATDTGYVGEMIAGRAKSRAAEEARIYTHSAALASVLRFANDCAANLATTVRCSPRLTQWSSGISLLTRYRYEQDDGPFDLSVTACGGDRYRVGHEDGQLEIEIGPSGEGAARVRIDGQRHDVRYLAAGAAGMWLSFAGRDRQFVNLLAVPPSAHEDEGGGRVAAPMHGVVLDIFVAEGDAVKKGQRLLVLEAMKMQHEIVAGVDGVVEDVHSKTGAQVASDDLLITIAEDGAAD